jgi:hypothetical protein
MTSINTLMLAAALALAAGAASAQMTTGQGSPSGDMQTPPMSSGAMSSDSMSSDSMKMSRMDQKTMKSCQAMDHDAMMQADKCKRLMAKHADMFNSDGTMKSGMSSAH